MIRLLGIDTDSLIDLMYTESLYKDLKQIKEHFDFSELPNSHHLYNVSNKRRPGCFKDEQKGGVV